MSDEDFKAFVIDRLKVLETKIDSVLLLRGRVRLLWFAAACIAARIVAGWVFNR